MPGLPSVPVMAGSSNGATALPPAQQHTQSRNTGNVAIVASTRCDDIFRTLRSCNNGTPRIMPNSNDNTRTLHNNNNMKKLSSQNNATRTARATVEATPPLTNSCGNAEHSAGNNLLLNHSDCSNSAKMPSNKHRDSDSALVLDSKNKKESDRMLLNYNNNNLNNNNVSNYNNNSKFSMNGVPSYGSMGSVFGGVNHLVGFAPAAGAMSADSGRWHAPAPPAVDLSHVIRTAPSGYQMQPPVQLTLSQLLALGSSVLGWQVLVQSSDGSYVGYICWTMEQCGRLGLEEVSRPETGVRRVGLLLLYHRTIDSVTLLAKRARNLHAAGRQSNVREERSGRSLLMKKLVMPHLQEKRRQQQQEEEEERQQEALPIPPLPPPVGRLQRPNTWRLVDRLGGPYQRAVSSIGECRRVGVSCFGHELGRWGELAWLCVATPDTVYLFDAATLGLHALLYGTLAKHNKTNKPSGNQDSDNKTPATANHGDDPVNGALRKDSLHLQNGPLKADPISHLQNGAANDVETTGETFECVVSKECNRTSESETIVGSDGGTDTAVTKETFNGAALPAKQEIASSNEEREPPLEINHVQNNKKQSLQDENQGNNLDNIHEGLIFQESCPANSAEQQDCRSTRPRAHATLHLAAILEDPHLEIVMHDSRNFCDFLQHRTETSICALYDTQGTDVYVHLVLQGGDCPAFVPALSGLLTRHLLLQPQHLLYESVLSHQHGDTSMYFERPVVARTLSGLASSAMFLCELRQRQLGDVLADLRQLTCLHATATALKDDGTRARVEQHVVPECVQRLGRRTVLNCLPRSAGPVWGRQPNYRRSAAAVVR